MFVLFFDFSNNTKSLVAPNGAGLKVYIFLTTIRLKETNVGWIVENVGTDLVPAVFHFWVSSVELHFWFATTFVF